MLTALGRLGLICTSVGGLALIGRRAPEWFATMYPAGALLGVAAAALVCVVLGYAAVRGSALFVQRTMLEGALLAAVLLAVETWVIATSPESWSRDRFVARALSLPEIARRQSVAFDERTISEVVSSLRAQGTDALPGIARSWAQQQEPRRALPEGFYPLSHAANVAVVECNEGGEYLVYRTDEFGFNNPRGLVSGGIDVALVGESHGLGYCVPAAESFAALIRRAHPRTANFSLADSRSLSMLATFREYVEPLRPPVVLWIVDPGFADPGPEHDDPVLSRYLDPAFSQGLIHRQSEVDAAVRQWVTALQAAADERLTAAIEQARANRFREVPKLRHVRSLFQVGSSRTAPLPEPDLAAFASVLSLVDQTVRKWDGRLLVVLIAQFGNIAGEAPAKLRHVRITEILHDLGIDFVDASDAFLAHDDPQGLFTLRTANHPNPAGHALLAARILQHIPP
jgi:hypothetical protein